MTLLADGELCWHLALVGQVTTRNWRTCAATHHKIL